MQDAMWVFGYGSLIWNPEFAVAERQIARLADWHRSFCMRSIHHRGSVADPGLVLRLRPWQRALDRARRIAAGDGVSAGGQGHGRGAHSRAAPQQAGAGRDPAGRRRHGPTDVRGRAAAAAEDLSSGSQNGHLV